MISIALHYQNGDCKRAMSLYEKAFTMTDVNISYYKDAPEDSGMSTDPRVQDWIMHSDLMLCGTHLNMCDILEEVSVGNMHILNVFVPTVEEVRKAYETLSENGEVVVPLGQQFFTPMYASVIDPYGVRWQIIMME